MPKKGATSINMKIVATAGQGGGGRSEVHDLRSLGLGHEELQITKADGTIVLSSRHVLEDLMLKHFADKDMAALSPEERKAVNAGFVADVNAAMESRGLTNKSDDPEDKRVMNHVDPKLTPLNDFLILHPLEDYLDNTLRPLVKELTGQKMQDKCTPFKEGVAVIKEDTTIEELLDFGKEVKKEIGWEVVQIYIHKDEGHFDKQTNEWVENRHAHLVFNTIDLSTGKTIQVNRLGLANMQTLLSQAIHMERGENSSDLAHLNSLEFKADMEVANTRLELSLSVAKLGKDPRQILADVVNSSIDATLTGKPNDRTTLNLLRVVGKDLFVNPTKLCADAIFKELKNQPDKISDIADILKIDTKKLKDLPTEAVLDTIHEDLLKKAVRCGKTESAKEFRPLLNSAKELGLDLTPVMLNPIKDRLSEIQQSPIDMENNHALFRCAERCKANPSEILQMAHAQGMAEKDELIAMKDKEIDEKNDVIYSQSQEIDSLRKQLSEVSDQLNYVAGKKDQAVKELDVAIQDKQVAIKEKDDAIQIKDDVISKTISTTGASISDAICKEIHSYVESKLNDPSSITKEGDVTKMAQACAMLDLKPNGIMADFIADLAHRNPEVESKICNIFSLDKDSYADSLKSLGERADSNNVLDRKILFTVVAPETFRELSQALLEKVDELAVSAKESPADMQKLKEVASHFNIDMLSVSKHAADDFTNDLTSIKEESDSLSKNVETKKIELDQIKADVEIKTTELESVTAKVDTKKDELSDLGSMIAKSENTVKNLADGVMNKIFKSSNDLEIQNAALQIDVKNLQSEVSRVKEESKDNLQKALNNLRDVHGKETDKLRSDISELKETVKSQEGQISQLKKDNSKIASERDAFKSLASAFHNLLEPAKRLLLDIGYAANQVFSIFKGDKASLVEGQTLDWKGHGRYTAKDGDTSHLVTKDNGDGTLYINDKIFDIACKDQEQEQSQQTKRQGPRI